MSSLGDTVGPGCRRTYLWDAATWLRLRLRYPGACTGLAVVGGLSHPPSTVGAHPGSGRAPLCRARHRAPREPTPRSGCLIHLREPTPRSGCLVRLREPTPRSGCLVRLREPTPRSGCLIHLREPTPRWGCLVRLREPTSRSVCLVRLREPTPRSGYLVRLREGGRGGAGCVWGGGGGEACPVCSDPQHGDQPTASTLALWWLKFGPTGDRCDMVSAT